MYRDAFAGIGDDATRRCADQTDPHIEDSEQERLLDLPANGMLAIEVETLVQAWQESPAGAAARAAGAHEFLMPPSAQACPPVTRGQRGSLQVAPPLREGEPERARPRCGLGAGLGGRRPGARFVHDCAFALWLDGTRRSSKEVVEGRTLTRVTQLDGESRVDELTRMLGGGGAAARQHAEELLS